MATRFNGTLQEFKDKLAPLGLEGEWEQLANGVHKFKCRDRAGTAGVLWSETKGTVWYDGPSALQDGLAAKVEPALADGSIVAPTPKDTTIFVVHGRDHGAREQLERVLHRLGLEPFVLQLSGGGGDTLIEAHHPCVPRSSGG